MKKYDGLLPSEIWRLMRLVGEHAKLREDRSEARRVSEISAMDFVHDQLTTGHKIRVLTIVDIVSRFSAALDARFRYRGEDVVQTLEQVCKGIGYLKSIRVEQGSEFISRDLDLGTHQRGVILNVSRRDNRRTTASLYHSTTSFRRMFEHAPVHKP